MSDLSKQPKIIGFAGHRKLPDREGLGERLGAELKALKNDLGDRLIAMCSAAAGADLVFLRKCIELRIPAIVILPFPEERFSKDFEDELEWLIAEKLLSVALSKYVSPRGLQAPESYQAVSRNLVEWADVFLFAWDGEPPRELDSPISL